MIGLEARNRLFARYLLHKACLDSDGDNKHCTECGVTLGSRNVVVLRTVKHNAIALTCTNCAALVFAEMRDLGVEFTVEDWDGLTHHNSSRDKVDLGDYFDDEQGTD